MLDRIADLVNQDGEFSTFIRKFRYDDQPDQQENFCHHCVRSKLLAKTNENESHSSLFCRLAKRIIVFPLSEITSLSLNDLEGGTYV